MSLPMVTSSVTYVATIKTVEEQQVKDHNPSWSEPPSNETRSPLINSGEPHVAAITDQRPSYSKAPACAAMKPTVVIQIAGDVIVVVVVVVFINAEIEQKT